MGYICGKQTVLGMSRNRFSCLSAAILIACGIIITSCGGRDNVDSGFSAYVEAFTGGIVSGNADVIVELTAPVTGDRKSVV